MSDVEVPSIAETLQASGIDPKDAGRTDTVSSSTSLADETPDTDYSEAIETAREASADAPRPASGRRAATDADLGGQPGASDDGGATRA